jgi:hypothetical protein
VSGIEYHRTAGCPHHRQGTHIGYQVIVAKAGTPFADHDLRVANGTGLVNHVHHIPGGQKLPFFDVHRFALPGYILDEIGDILT